MAASGLASREWFAERIATLHAEARGSAACGQVRFGDPDVGWRDHDGPRETLGYRGGALLAFQADVELRRQGRPGLLTTGACRSSASAPPPRGQSRSPRASRTWMRRSRASASS